MLGIKQDYALNDTFFNFDYLSNRYPVFSPKIKHARGLGFSDDEIERSLRRVEARFNFFAKKDEVNNFLGRSPDTIQLDADYQNVKMFNAYKLAHPDKSDDDISNAIGVSQWSGISTSTLLQNNDLFKKLTEGKKVSESRWESLYRGANNYVTQRDISRVGYQLWAGHISLDDALKQEEELAKNYIPEPIVQDRITGALAGGASVMTQGWITGLKGAATGVGLGGIGAIVGFPFGMSAQGFALGQKAGYTIATVDELLALQAGSDMLMLSKLTDEKGQPLDPNACRVASLITGAITVATELGTLGATAKLIPGGQALMNFSGLGRQAVIDTLKSNPVVRYQLSQIAIDMTKGIGLSTINNVVEAIGGALAIPMAETFSGQTLQPYSLNLPDKIKDAFNTWQHFAVSALFSLPGKAIAFNKWAGQYKQGVRDIAQATGLPEALVDRLNAEAIKQKQLEAIAQSENNNNQETAPVIEPAQENIAPALETTQAENTVAPQPQTTDAQPPKYIFIPKQAFSELTQNHPEFASLETLNAGSEIGLSPNDWNNIQATDPAFAQSVFLSTREGADGITVKEAVKAVEGLIAGTQQDKHEAFHSDENQKVITQTTEAFQNAGLPQEAAQTIGNIVGTLNATSLADEGVSIIPISVITDNDTPPDLSRLNPEYDINNPETWPDKQRALQYSELSKQAQLPDIIQTTRDLLGFLAERDPDKADSLSESFNTLFKGLKEDIPQKLKSTLRDLLRSELDDYRNALTASGIDVTDSIASLALNPDRYELNSAFPHGKRRNPDYSYSFEQFGTGAKIDFATDGLNLAARIKLQGRKEPLTFTIKNYRNADFQQIISDLTSQQTIAGANIYDTPLGKFLYQSLYSLWDELDLPKVPVVREDIPQTEVTAIRDGIPEPEVSAIREKIPEAEVNSIRENIPEPEINAVHEAIPEQEKPVAVRESIPESEVAAIRENIPQPDVPVIREGIPETEKPAAVREEIPQPENPTAIRENIPEQEKPVAVREEIPTQEKPNANKDNFNNIGVQAQRGGVPIEIITSPTDRSKMPLPARMKLNHDEAAWHNSVDEILADPNISTKSRGQVRVMNTPGVLTLVGARLLPLNINNGKLSLILRDHTTMTTDLLKDVPRAITDPVAIFSSKKDGHVILTDLKDANGASIITAIHIDQQGNINKLASAYPKATPKGKPRNQWFADQIQEGNLLYINRDKAQLWEQDTGIQLLQQADLSYAQNENDLVNFWNQHEQDAFYYTDPAGQHLSSIFWANGRAFIRYASSALHSAVSSTLQTATNFVAAIHEVGHNAFRMIEKLANAGSVQKKEDFLTILDWAGVSEADYRADRHTKGGAKEIVNEKFAQGWLAYLSEGKAPTEKLQPVFDRARNFILEVYDDISTQLNISLSDNVRDVFDRLLTLPEESEASIVDFVQRDLRLSRQIEEYEKQRQALERDFAETEATRLEVEQNPHSLDLDQKAEEDVLTYIAALDDNQTRQEMLTLRQQENKTILNAIKHELGYRLSGADLRRLIGVDETREIAKKFRSIWGGYKGGTTMDLFASGLADLGFRRFAEYGQAYSDGGGGDTDLFLDWLMNFDPRSLKDTIPNLDPSVPVNVNTLNAFLAYQGSEFTIDYLRDRLRFLEKRAQNPDAPTNQLEADSAEFGEINSWLKRLTPDLDEGIKPPKRSKISPKDIREAISAGATVAKQEQKASDELIIQTLNDRAKARREADKVKHQERLQTIIDRLNQKSEQKLSRTQDSFRRKIDRLNQRIRTLKESRARTSQRLQTNRLVNSILRMSKARSILVPQLNEINELLRNYSLRETRTQQKRNDILRNFFTIINDADKADFMLENDITQQELDSFLDQIHIDEMTPQELQQLHAKVKAIYDLGRRNFAIWQQEKDNARIGIQKQLDDAIISTTKPPKERVIKGPDDLLPSYVLGRFGDLLHSYGNAIQTPGRFLQALGEPFRRIFEDRISEKRAIAFEWLHTREVEINEGLQKLGLNVNKLTDVATYLDGNYYTWSQLMHIYLGLRNEKNKAAILWGNFIKNPFDEHRASNTYDTYEQAEAAIGQLMQFLHQHPQYEQAANLFAEDFSKHFDRINRAQIEDFNRQLNREEDYFPMFRLATSSRQGLIDADMENLADAGQRLDFLQKVADSFTKQRLDLNPMNQQPILLDILTAWNKAAHMQEFNAALGRYAADITSALLLRGQHGSIKGLISQRLGKSYWKTLKDIFNDSINDNIVKETDATGTIANWFVRARSVTYIPFSPVTIVAQFFSYFLAIPYSNWGHMVRSLANAISSPQRFMEGVFNLAPELRFSAGDPIDRATAQALRNFSKWGQAAHAVSSTVAKGYKPSSWVDQWTKCIVFDAVYKSEIENGSEHQQAINKANRVLAETQPASQHWQQARFLRAGGVNKLFFSQFMNALVPMFNMTFVDTYRNLVSPSWNSVKDTGLKLLAVSMAFGAAAWFKDFFSGRLPTGEELPNGEVDDWWKWGSETLVDNFINIIPVFNRFANSIRVFSGRRPYRNEDRIVEPFDNLLRGIKDLGDEDKSSAATGRIIEGLAQFGVPIPYNAIKQWLQFFGVGQDNQ